ncbi:MAG TPA: hypothetical protein VFO40_05105 [Chthoniobacterales bacterium]|nr:hypothetical protein [Chthoniobacterales bacterium]
MEEPLWRDVLCWGAVITFFSMPLAAFVLHVVSLESHMEFAKHLSDFKWLGNVYTAVSALVFGLAGLNSWDKRNGSKYKEPELLTKRERSARSDSP